MEIHEALASNLQKIMSDRDLCGLQLSYLSSVSPARISDLLRAKRPNPGIRNIKRLAVALDVSVDSLLAENKRGDK
jgi:transcriptional regulator with XRE-family HTH domain